MLYYWEFVGAHQLLQQSLLQQLTSTAGAANASAAPSTVSSTGTRSSRGGVDDRQNDQQQTSKMAPLVANIDKLAAIYECMTHERARDREQLKELEDNRAFLEERQMERKRKFELRDFACQYRQERIQLDRKGENVAVLKEFYNEEIESIEVELGELVDASTADNREYN